MSMHEPRESLGKSTGATADGMVVVVGDVPAAAMTVAVLDLLRAAGRSVIPRCPFVRDFLARHDELWDLVPERHRHMIRRPFRPAQATTDSATVLGDERVANEHHPRGVIRAGVIRPAGVRR